MSLLNVTVRQAQLVGPQAFSINAYVTVKLQDVKSVTQPIKGPQPCWEKDFLFEIDKYDSGLLIELWDKGMLWDKAIGYFWAPLHFLQFTRLEPGGRWLPLDSEVVIEEGQILCTKNPTGHSLLIDYKFELPKDLNAGNSLEIQEKLERLNQIMSEDWQRIDPTRRMFLSQSDYNEDLINWVLGGQ